MIAFVDREPAMHAVVIVFVDRGVFEIVIVDCDREIGANHGDLFAPGLFRSLFLLEEDPR